MHPLILFLDFDGVLHRGTTGTVRHAPALAEVLVKYPEVKVVISSTWRFQNSLEELQEWLPSRLAEKVIDVTPVVDSGSHRRQQEIHEWLNANPTRHWLALDDESAQFLPGCANLLLTDIHSGLTPSDLQELDRRIAALLRN